MRSKVAVVAFIALAGCGSSSTSALEDAGASPRDAGAESQAGVCVDVPPRFAALGPPRRIATAPNWPAHASRPGLAWSGGHALIATYDDTAVGSWHEGVHAVRLDGKGDRTDPSTISIADNQSGIAVGIDAPMIAAHPAGGWVVAYSAASQLRIVTIDGAGAVKQRASAGSEYLRGLVGGSNSVYVLTAQSHRIEVAADGTLGTPATIAPPTPTAMLLDATLAPTGGLLVYTDGGTVVGVDTDANALEGATTHALGTGWPYAAATRGSDHAVLLIDSMTARLAVARGNTTISGGSFAKPWNGTVGLAPTSSGYVAVGGSATGIWSVEFDANGDPVGTPAIVAAAPSVPPALAASDSGELMVAWTAAGDQTNETVVRTAVLGGAGTTTVDSWTLDRQYERYGRTIRLVRGATGALAVLDGTYVQALDDEAHPIGSATALGLYQVGGMVATTDGYWVGGRPYNTSESDPPPQLLLIGPDGTLRGRKSLPLPVALGVPVEVAWHGHGGFVASAGRVHAVDSQGAPVGGAVTIDPTEGVVTLHAAVDGVVLANRSRDGVRESVRLDSNGAPVGAAVAGLFAPPIDSWSCGPSCWVLLGTDVVSRIELTDGALRATSALLPFQNSGDAIGCVAVSARQWSTSTLGLVVGRVGDIAAGDVTAPFALVPLESLEVVGLSPSRFWVAYTAWASTEGGPPGTFVNEITFAP